MATVSPSDGLALARQARERFAAEVAELIGALPGRISVTRGAAGAKKTLSQALEAMEAEAAFRQKSGAWIKAVQRLWRGKAQGLSPGKTGLADLGLASTESGNLAGLTLVDNDAMDRTLAAGRLAGAIRAQAEQQLTPLRARLQRLEDKTDFVSGDVLRPETLAQALLDAWAECGLTPVQWQSVQDTLHQHAALGLGKAYQHANDFLAEHGVTDQIDLRAKVRRASDRTTVPGSLPGALYPASFGGGYGLSGFGAIASGVGDLVYASPGSAARAQYEAAFYGSGRGVLAGGAAASAPMAFAAGAAASGWGGLPVTVTSLGAWQRQRAQSVLGDLRQFARLHGAAWAMGGLVQPMSPVLALALAQPAAVSFRETQYLLHGSQDQAGETEPTVVEDIAGQIKDEAQALKDKTGRPDEKAIIEIVSLMFQAILTDERLPPALRVWFGRLQVPVLRVALAEPEFFAAADYPARQLIDLMGACAMGLGHAEVDDGQLEQEIKRVVQIIEQYPETGKKVFQVVLEEFERFLGDAAAPDQAAQKFATLAQQIEQKEALAIQYTIELRKMLGAAPISEDVRQFLFRVWAEVLALAAARRGAQAAQTLRFKQTAIDLLWAVGPKTDRAERQQITQHLPGILRALRQGMQTLAMQADEQDGHIHLISQAVTQAFHSTGKGIAPAQMNQLASALISLEDVVTDDPEGDLLLDPSLLEQILGVDGEDLAVIATGGARPDADSLQWAGGLQPGQWLTLQYQGAPARVQYVWRSARGQLHLFTAAAGKSYLVQTRRLAAYRQADLIAPVDDETLTTRATREVLSRLDQEPELLLH
jgi:hypothetical protein